MTEYSISVSDWNCEDWEFTGRNLECEKRGEWSDACKSLGVAQDHIRQRKHKKTLKKIRQELNKILDS